MRFNNESYCAVLKARLKPTSDECRIMIIFIYFKFLWYSYVSCAAMPNDFNIIRLRQQNRNYILCKILINLQENIVSCFHNDKNITNMTWWQTLGWF